MRFWLDLGVDGLRLDAVAVPDRARGDQQRNLPETHEVLRRLRCELDKHYADRMLLAEPINGLRTFCNISAPAMNATWRFTSR